MFNVIFNQSIISLFLSKLVLTDDLTFIILNCFYQILRCFPFYLCISDFDADR